MKKLLFSIACILSISSVASSRQEKNFAIIKPSESLPEIVREAASITPSPRQLAWQRLEFIAFAHYGINTFMDQEWGNGSESPSAFNPTDFDARQWVSVLKSAGVKLLILTAKHHDGFCLWPSKYTEHSVKNSPWRGGKGDVVGEVARACAEGGLKFGIYLSPWDRHEPTYGDSPVYNEHFCNQLRELLTNYGEIAEVWFDGANAEGPNEKKQVYDWQSYYRLIRELQPNAVIAIMGPDVRWVGTESGYGRKTEWSVVPNALQNVDAIAAASQQAPVDGAFVPRDLTGEDLGSRDKLMNASSLVWYPAETDVSIRPGWFYHSAQDDQVKSPSKLVDIYYSSVGRNSVLLLNVPPDKRGRITDHDINSLTGMRKILDQTFRTNLAAGARITASGTRPGYNVSNLLQNHPVGYWITKEGVDTATIELRLTGERAFDRLMVQEEITVGQRIESFRLDVFSHNNWKEAARGTTVGYKRLLRFPAATTQRVRLVIESSRTSPALSAFGLYKAPPTVSIEPGGGSFQDSLRVRLSSDTRGAAIYYTLDGSTPTLTSPRRTGPVTLTRSAVVRAAASVKGERAVELSEARFTKCLHVKSIVLENPYNAKYPGRGDATLIDGQRGSLDFQKGEWLGFNGDDVVATLDLGRSTAIRTISIGFLQQQGSWIFLPINVKFYLSDDGMNWKEEGEASNPVQQTESVLVKDFSCSVSGVPARYVKVAAKNVGSCPPWHPGAGDKAWLFVDEVAVE